MERETKTDREGRKREKEREKERNSKRNHIIINEILFTARNRLKTFAI